ncbi:hypothetical protein ACHAXN_003324 [Cyclotella atomus]
MMAIGTTSSPPRCSDYSSKLLHHTIIAIHHDDGSTIPHLKSFCSVISESFDNVTNLKYKSMKLHVVKMPADCHGSADALRFLSTEEEGRERYIPPSSHAVVLPSDLILEGDLLLSSNKNPNEASCNNNILTTLIAQHRQWTNEAGVSLLLTDVGSEDKEGIPLKESSKAKMGKFSRDEEDMEYIGLSSEVCFPIMGGLHSTSFSSSSLKYDGGGRRVVLKRSKIEVEEGDGTGNTTKLMVSKRRLHGGKTKSNGADITSWMMNSATAGRDASPSISLRTDLHDVHVYVISNWVFELLHARPNMASFQKEVLPLLISRQFRGVEGAFGPTAWKVEGNRERLKRVLKGLDDETGGGGTDYAKISSLLGMYSSAKRSGGLGGFYVEETEESDRGASDELDGNLLSPSFPSSVHPYAVSAHVLSRETSSLVLRACTIPTLLYGCGEITSKTLKLDTTDAIKLLPKGTQLNTKFNSILLPNCKVGEKVQTKSCTIGSNVTLGDRSKLNNVLVMDGAVIGENVVLQNSVVGMGATVGDNCNLKDCMVGSKAVVNSGTRTTEKGEAFHV